MLVQLTNMEQWRALKSKSEKLPIVMFKHSNSSPASSEMLQLLRQAHADGLIDQPIHLVVTQENKEISDAVAKDLGIENILPQVIIIKNKQSQYFSRGENFDLAILEKLLKN